MTTPDERASPSIHQLAAEIAALRQAIQALAALPQTQMPLQAQLAEKERQLTLLQQSGGINLGTGNTFGAMRDIVAGDSHTHIYGSGTSDPDVLLREYLRALGGACSRLSLADADSSDPGRAAVELAAVYTGLEIASTVELPEAGRQGPERQHRQRTALEALAGQPRLVLLGEPGGGKSSFLNFVGLCLARARLGAPDWLEQLGAGWRYGALLPIRVTLREFAAWVAALKPQPQRADGALFWRWMADAQGEQLAGLLRQEVAAGRALLLLDGLDEVPADVQDQPLA